MLRVTDISPCLKLARFSSTGRLERYRAADQFSTPLHNDNSPTLLPKLLDLLWRRKLVECWAIPGELLRLDQHL